VGELKEACKMKDTIVPKEIHFVSAAPWNFLIICFSFVKVNYFPEIWRVTISSPRKRMAVYTFTENSEL
jgi:hypothetical protein